MKYPAHTWNRTPDSPARSTVTTPTELFPSKQVSTWYSLKLPVEFACFITSFAQHRPIALSNIVIWFTRFPKLANTFGSYSWLKRQNQRWSKFWIDATDFLYVLNFSGGGGRCGPTRAMASSFLRFLDHIHNDTPQSVGLLWTRDQPVAETSTWQHTTLTTDRHPRPRWDSNPQSQQASGPQTYALDRAATCTCLRSDINLFNP